MLAALSFLTIVGAGRAPDRRTFAWFPAVGAALGGVLALTWWGAQEVWSPLVAAALVLTLDLALTGMLHLDGLADSADGLLPHMDTERRLAVMRQSDSGAFALGVVGVVLLLRWSALASAAVVNPAMLAVIWAAGRLFASLVPVVLPYARPEGLAGSFLDGARPWLALWLLPVVAAGVLLEGWRGAIAIAAAAVVALVVAAWAKRQIGGFTGDVLGAVIVLAETAALIALAGNL